MAFVIYTDYQRDTNKRKLGCHRFDYNQSFGGKITKQVEYTEYLNLRPYMTSQGAPIKYRLYAVLVHSGYSSNSGHYYCYVRASNGIWYLMNDSSVRQVTLKAVLSQQAYLLFYTKLTPTQELKSPSLNSPRTTPPVKTPGTPKDHQAKVIQPNDFGTPVKSGIHFHRTPPSTSTVTKPLTTSTTNPAPSVPLASASQRPKFTFTIPAANKGNKPDMSKAKQDRNKLGEKGENIGMQAKSSSSTDAPSEIKSPIASSDKRTETVTQSEGSQLPAQIDGSSVNEKGHVNFNQKEETKMSSEENVSSKKEEKGKAISSPKKPRPPPLFIPRAVVQGKATPHSTPRATTPWKVTPKTTTEPLFGPMSPPPPGVAPPQPSPSSALSDTSSTSSVMGKTGEWTVTDKTILTPGPKLPERQHAGWQVSRKPETEAEELGTPKGGGDAELNGKESDKKKKKKKHKKEKKKKRKKEKCKKKYDRLSESDTEEEENKEKEKQKKQKKDKSVEENRSEVKSKSKKHKRKHKGYDDDDNNVSPSKKPCLVSYADSSSSSSDEHASNSRESEKPGNVNDSQGSSTQSRVPVIHDDEPRKKNASRRATWDGSRDSSTVTQLLSGSKGLHGYGSLVTSWEGGESVVDSSISGRPDRKRQRRDSWDEDYDRGKEKKVKKNKDIRERHFNGNPFQREHERRSTKQGFKDRFSRQLSKNHHSHHGHFSKSHSSRKYRRLSS